MTIQLNSHFTSPLNPVQHYRQIRMINNLLISLSQVDCLILVLMILDTINALTCKDIRRLLWVLTRALSSSLYRVTRPLKALDVFWNHPLYVWIAMNIHFSNVRGSVYFGLLVWVNQQQKSTMFEQRSLSLKVINHRKRK